MDENVSKSGHFFESHGIKCAADLYLPAEASEKLPCIIMAHGFSGTKDMLPAFANQFALNGFAVLAFDYRHFGESEGSPRQIINIRKQREDYSAAIEFVHSLDFINSGKIVLWGSSLSGGHVLHVASKDPSIAAVIVQVPFIDAYKGGGSENAPAKIKLKLIYAALRDTVHGLFRLPPYLVPVIGKPREYAAMTEPDAMPLADSLLNEGSSWRNEFAPRVAFQMPRYAKGTAESLKIPVLFCIAEFDIQASPAYAVKIAKKISNVEIKIYRSSHFGIYTGKMREQVISDQLEFLYKNLS